jgi:hypothetical protein
MEPGAGDPARRRALTRAVADLCVSLALRDMAREGAQRQKAA